MRGKVEVFVKRKGSENPSTSTEEAVKGELGAEK